MIKKADFILRKLSKFTKLENEYPFVECATFADEIKQAGF